MSENLLKNPSFEDGWTNPDGVPEIQEPKGWNFWHSTLDNPHSEWPFVRPEVRVLHVSQLPEAERELFVLTGDYCLKIFKGHGAWHAGLKQVLSLPVGSYKFTVRVYPDLVKGYGTDGGKIWADDPEGLDGLCRFSINGTQYDWTNLKAGAWVDLSIVFRSAGGLNGEGHTEIGVEWLCAFALANSGIFADDWRLEKLPAPPPPRGHPREDYKRVVNVIPPDATDDEALRIFTHSWAEGRQTVTGSYDDAGVGDLSDRTAVLWNIPAGAQEEYRAFYEKYYPGVTIVFKELS